MGANAIQAGLFVMVVALLVKPVGAYLERVFERHNWRIDCGVAAYDNRHGLPPFFPTRLRFKDYIYRLWTQQPKIVSAHVDPRSVT